MYTVLKQLQYIMLQWYKEELVWIVFSQSETFFCQYNRIGASYGHDFFYQLKEQGSVDLPDIFNFVVKLTEHL